MLCYYDVVRLTTLVYAPWDPSGHTSMGAPQRPNGTTRKIKATVDLVRNQNWIPQDRWGHTPS